jgi:hypothetical protein
MTIENDIKKDTIKTKLVNLLNAREEFNYLNSYIFKEISAVSCFDIMNIIDEVNENVLSFEKIYNEKIVNFREPEKDDQGNEIPGKFKFIEETYKDFEKDINALLENEIEFNSHKIDINSVEKIPFSPAQLRLLKWMFKK